MLVNPKIVACLSLPRITFTDNMIALLNLNKMGMTVHTYGGAYWEQGLSRVMEQALADHPDYILTVDYDSLFSVPQAKELIRIAEVTSADFVFPLQLRRGGPQALIDVLEHEYTKDNSIDINREWMEARAGHFGLTVIRVSALERMPLPWFWSMPADRGPNRGRWTGKEGCRYPDGKLDADMSFWQIAHNEGMKILLAPRVRIGHIQRMITWPSPHGVVTQYLEQYQEHGIPEEVGVVDLPLEEIESSAVTLHSNGPYVDRPLVEGYQPIGGPENPPEDIPEMASAVDVRGKVGESCAS